MVSGLKKLTIEDLVGSETPYFDLFGTESRGAGRPSGSYLDYSTSMEIPSARAVPDRAEAKRIRNKIRHRATMVLQALFAEEMKKIYNAELRLELARLQTGGDGTGRPAAVAASTRQLLSKDDAKKMPGSGLLPGETYWDWMKTFGDKDDEQWAQEKVTVAANIAAVQRGQSNG